ncbi:MAG: endo-1,3-alpha-glucanase family glycosylhydrolase [Myxococcaceae bacterium]
MRRGLILLSAGLVACTGHVSEEPRPDSGHPEADAGFDGGTDAGFDAGTDAGFDAGTDAGFDGGADAGFDGGADAGFDGGTDAGIAGYYSTHLMVAFVPHAHDLRAWVQALKDAGYNHLWAHMDAYDTFYPVALKNLMDAAQDVGGIWVSPGTAGGMPDTQVAQVIIDTFNHPALFHLEGRAIYLDYGHNPSQYQSATQLLADAGYPRASWRVLGTTLYGVNYTGTWMDYVTGTPGDVAAVGHAYDIDATLDGLIDFAVDKGTSDPATGITRTVNENQVISDGSRARGKLSMAGVNGFYASVQTTDYGFSGAAQLWEAILDGGTRPDFVNDTTANDYVELSYFSPMENPPDDGGSYVPILGAGYVLGATVRTPLADHSGLQRFLRPWADAYRTGAAAPVFAADRLFAWYYLNPASALTLATEPTEVAALDPTFTQSWWSGTLYATGASQVGGMNQIDNIRTHNATQMGVIRLAAHLTAPAQLQINGTTSTATFPAGPAYFEVPQTNGVPTFAIIRNGVTVKSGSGPMAISDSDWPGGWNPLITEIP